MGRWRRRRRRSRLFVTILILGGLAGATGWYWQNRHGAVAAESAAGAGDAIDSAGNVELQIAMLAGANQDDDSPDQAMLVADEQPKKAVAPDGRVEESDRSAARSPAITAARELLESGKPIEARRALSALLGKGLEPAQEREVRRLLAQVAERTIFSKKRLPQDPLVELYAIQPGDLLINIGRRFDVPAEIIMRINGISDPTRIRANQKIKVPRGPFHARIHKSRFRLDLYLRDIYLRSFPVALGLAGATPEGTWKVKERLSNPTYFPPATAEDKRIIAADDPTNPLGEHWIGLEGIDGDAVGRHGYGIHGTIDPESIGKAISLGCIRMQNDDVALLYSTLRPGSSTVTILP